MWLLLFQPSCRSLCPVFLLPLQRTNYCRTRGYISVVHFLRASQLNVTGSVFRLMIWTVFKESYYSGFLWKGPSLNSPCGHRLSFSKALIAFLRRQWLSGFINQKQVTVILVSFSSECLEKCRLRGLTLVESIQIHNGIIVKLMSLKDGSSEKVVLKTCVRTFLLVTKMELKDHHWSSR